MRAHRRLVRRASALLNLRLRLRREHVRHAHLGSLVVWVVRSHPCGPLASGLCLATHPQRTRCARLALDAARRIAAWRVP